MNKYKLINKTTGEEHICEKVVIDGWDYYVNDEKILNGDYCVHPTTLNISQHNFDNNLRLYWKKITATNNPNIDIPKVVNETWIFFKEVDGTCEKDQYEHWLYKSGYNKSQETHPFSEEDMIEFDKWKNEKYKLLHSEYVDTNDYYSIPNLKSVKKYTTKELLQLWKEQRTKTLYYE